MTEAVTQMCYIKDTLKSLSNFTGKYLCQSLFSNKVTDVKPATSLKKILVQLFFFEFDEICGQLFKVFEGF